MRKTFLTPGPSELYFTVEDHLRTALRDQIPSLSHRSKAFRVISRQATDGIKELLGLSPDWQVFFLTSATEAWERIAQELVIRQSHHYVHGAFGKKFYETAKAWGKEATLAESVQEVIFDAPAPTDADLIGLTYNETSTGFQLNHDILKTVRSAHPDKLIALDVVSAIPGVNVDFSLVDTAYFSVQKGFGLPAGLGVWLVNERCMARAQSNGYHGLKSLQKFAVKNETPETPNVLGIYLLGKVVEDMARRGIRQLQNETVYKSTLLYQVLDNHPLIRPFIINPTFRSKTTITLACGTQTEGLRNHLETHGLLAGEGYGAWGGQHLRIANFPTHSKETFEKLCDVIEKFE
jgi:phosphoserine aminotransferase